MSNERGMSLIELLAVLGLAGVVLSAVAAGSFLWIRQQASLSAVYHVQSFLQSARVEAVMRNRACRFLIEPASHTVRVVDLNDPALPGDDVQVSSLVLSATSRFERPDPGEAVSLPEVAAGVHEAVFESDGVVSSGAGGEIVLWGGKRYHRLTLYGAGGVRVERWNGGGWTAGP